MSNLLRGGLGGTPTGGIRDVRMINRALKSGWDVPPEVRAKVTARLLAVVDDKAASRREVTSASDSLMRAAAIDQRSIELVIAVEAHEDFRQRLDRLEGAGGDTCRYPTSPSTSNNR